MSGTVQCLIGFTKNASHLRDIKKVRDGNPTINGLIYSDMKKVSNRILAGLRLKIKKRETGIEPATPSLARRCSTAEPLAHTTTGFHLRAGDGNRTHVSSLEGWCSTIELHPQVSGWQDSNLRPPGPTPGALAKLSHTPKHLLCFTTNVMIHGIMEIVNSFLKQFDNLF